MSKNEPEKAREPAEPVRVEVDILDRADELAALPRARALRLRRSQLVSAAARFGLQILAQQLGESGDVLSKPDIDALAQKHADYLREWSEVVAEMPAGTTSRDVSLEVGRRRMARGLPAIVDLNALHLGAVAMSTPPGMIFVGD